MQNKPRSFKEAVLSDTFMFAAHLWELIRGLLVTIVANGIVAVPVYLFYTIFRSHFPQMPYLMYIDTWSILCVLDLVRRTLK